MFRVLLTRRLIDAFFILLACWFLSGCQPAANRSAQSPAPGDRTAARLAADPGAVAELKRIDALLAARRPVTRLDIDSLERLRPQYPTSPVVGKLLQGALIARVAERQPGF